MSGQKINDHSSWIGGGAKFPQGVKTKAMKDAAGDGHVADYPDTSSHIERDQEKGISHAKKHSMKPGYRY